MTYADAVAYLDSFVNYEKAPRVPYGASFKLARIQRFLGTIGNPQRSLRCVHVAGTKGKGSTCMCIAAMLHAAGYRVGLYTSPHLSQVRERIRILPGSTPRSSACHEGDFEGMIPKQALMSLVRNLKPSIERFAADSRYGQLSFFEVYTALAFLYFKLRRVEIAVLETGLGGRLDATNAAESLVCAITPISFDHTFQLGRTLSAIAAEKAGIIKKKNAIVVSAPQKSAASKVIRRRCAGIGARLWRMGKELRLTVKKDSFDIAWPGGQWKGITVGLAGGHQKVNAAVGIGVIQALREAGITVDEAAAKKGLQEVVWPGRCEIVSRDPLTVLDGAQNEASCAALIQTIQSDFSFKRLILVLGVSKDKDIPGICRQLKSLAETVILTKSHNPRAAQPSRLKRYFDAGKVLLSEDVSGARRMARRASGANDMVLVCGSLFLVGEYRRLEYEKYPA